MAILAADQVTLLWQDGTSEHFALFAVKFVDSGDTFDFSAYFRIILQSMWMGATVSGVAAGSHTGTVETAPAGLTDAGAYLLIQGVAQ
jgi:predicted branched-subunit amino acid permease